MVEVVLSGVCVYVCGGVLYLYTLIPCNDVIKGSIAIENVCNISAASCKSVASADRFRYFKQQ